MFSRNNSRAGHESKMKAENNPQNFNLLRMPNNALPAIQMVREIKYLTIIMAKLQRASSLNCCPIASLIGNLNAIVHTMSTSTIAAYLFDRASRAHDSVHAKLPLPPASLSSRSYEVNHQPCF